jgi:CheY-like chemotaxis protein/anti-sigma regulatory factor (Ser/Thr protein kinase)
MVDVDPTRITQVIVNLLTNAAKYTPAGGRIVLRARREANEAVVSVCDTGIGIPREALASIFNMFSQLSPALERSQGGLGIGLALVRSLVELHYGSVLAHSDGVGLGCEFTVRLPRAPEANAPAAVRGESTDPGTTGSLRILIVDDNVDAAQMLAMFLEAAGHRVTIEHTPRAALARAQAEAPDVCLLDIGLPDMDGNELARRLRLQAGTRDAVMIAVTGYGQDQDRRNSEAAGFAHHLVKPIDTVKLMGLLAGISA